MVAWRSQDLPYYTPISAPLLARYTPAPYTSSQPGSTSKNRPASTGSSPKSPAASKTGKAAAGDNSSPSLSSGAGAGIGVGVAIAILALIALIVWLCVRRRRKAKRSQSGKDFSAIEQRDPAYEAGSADRYEISQSAAVPLEVDGTPSNRAEMDGYWHGYEVEDRERWRTKRGSQVYIHEE